jgi:hypothetical protein
MFIIVPLIVGAYTLTVSAKAATSEAVKRMLPRPIMIIAVVDPSDGEVLMRQPVKMGTQDVADLGACLQGMS